MTKDSMKFGLQLSIQKEVAAAAGKVAFQCAKAWERESWACKSSSPTGILKTDLVACEDLLKHSTLKELIFELNVFPYLRRGCIVLKKSRWQVPICNAQDWKPLRKRHHLRYLVTTRLWYWKVSRQIPNHYWASEAYLQPSKAHN